MGNKQKVQPAPRREPLRTVKEVLASNEAKEKVRKIMHAYPPGTSKRWNQILNNINYDIGPSETEPDPLRIVIEIKTLRSILKYFYDEMRFVDSEGLALSRECIPKLYDKHSIERGRRVSQREREAKGIKDECFAYGEVNFEVFSTMFLKSTSIYGLKKGGVFYDLGCGVGNLMAYYFHCPSCSSFCVTYSIYDVFVAALLGRFSKVVGIEGINNLLERGEKRMNRWNQLKDGFPIHSKNTRVEWVADNFLFNDFWVKDADFIFLHWTAFSVPQRETMMKHLSGCGEGTVVISFTNPIPGDDFEVLIKDACMTSWGKADFFYQERKAPSSQQTGRDGNNYPIENPIPSTAMRREEKEM